MLISFLIFGACTKESTVISENLKLTESLNASQYSNLYFSGQPSMKDFEELKKEGFVAVINLRSEKEENYDQARESDKIKELKMAYEHVAFDKDAELSDELIKEITSKVSMYKKKGKVLIHCSSGNRVGLWLGGHFFKDHKYSKEESKKIAQKLGLKKNEAIEKLEAYLQSK